MTGVDPVHPHACGERVFWFANNMTFSRFIPTHVGNGEIFECHLIYKPVHPHACGERTESIFGIMSFAGSSPRMWGTDPSLSDIGNRIRFIPTHVGNGV